jgi:hypothetical protein
LPQKAPTLCKVVRFKTSKNNQACRLPHFNLM